MRAIVAPCGNGLLDVLAFLAAGCFCFTTSGASLVVALDATGVAGASEVITPPSWLCAPFMSPQASADPLASAAAATKATRNRFMATSGEGRGTMRLRRNSAPVNPGAPCTVAVR